MARKTLAILAFLVSALISGAPVAAQDIVPIISPGQAAEGVFSRSRGDAQTRQQREEATSQTTSQAPPKPEPGTPEFQKQACDNRPLYRRQYGEDHPQVQKLEEICKAAGY